MIVTFWMGKFIDISVQFGYFPALGIGAVRIGWMICAFFIFLIFLKWSPIWGRLLAFSGAARKRGKFMILGAYAISGMVGLVYGLVIWALVERAYRMHPKQEIVQPPQISSNLPSSVPRPEPPARKTESKPIPKNGDNAGLSFTEVPPEKFGLEKTRPKEFTVEFATNRFTFATEQLKNKLPFDTLMGFGGLGDFPLKIYFNKKGEMKVDATLYASDKSTAAVIKASNFSILSEAWDRNWDATAFEIVDEKKNPIFQIERTEWNHIKLMGVFVTSKGTVVAGNDQGLTINPTSPIAPIKRLFRYPSAGSPHSRDTNVAPAKKAPQPDPLPLKLLRYSYENTNSTKEDFPYAIRVILQTTVEIQRPAFLIKCDDTVEDGEVKMVGVSAFFGLKEGIRPNAAEKTEWGFSFNAPSFPPETPIVVTLHGKRPLKVVDVFPLRTAP